LQVELVAPRLSALRLCVVSMALYKYSFFSFPFLYQTSVQSNLTKGRIADFLTLVAENGFIRPCPYIRHDSLVPSESVPRLNGISIGCPVLHRSPVCPTHTKESNRRRANAARTLNKDEDTKTC